MVEHTLLTFKVKPAGGKSYFHAEMIKDRTFDSQEDAEAICEWGGELNWIIEEFVDNSKFGMLEYWDLVGMKIVTASDLGIQWALTFMEIKETKREIAAFKDLNENPLPDNFWLEPSGKVHEVNGFHVDFAETWLRDNHEYKRAFTACYDSDMHWDWSFSDYMEGYKGWMRVQGWGRCPNGYCKIPPTSSQWKVVIKYCRMRNIEIDDFIYKQY